MNAHLQSTNVDFVHLVGANSFAGEVVLLTWSTAIEIAPTKGPKSTFVDWHRIR